MTGVMMGQAGVSAAAAAGIVVTVSGGNWDHNDPTGAIAGVRISSSGSVSKLLGASFTRVSGGTDWIIPNSAASSQYEVMATTVSGSPTSGPALATWHNLGTSRTWSISETAGNVAGFVILIQIRFNPGSPGPVLDSANYNVTANAV